MSPPLLRLLSLTVSGPRASGDEPRLFLEFLAVNPWSPRERG